MSHYQKDADTERGYSMQTKPSSFLEQAKIASVEILDDETTRPNQLRWDKKTHSFVRPTVGADNKKRIRTDSGLSVDASYKTDRYVNNFYIQQLIG